MIKHTVYPDRGYVLIVIDGAPALDDYIAGTHALAKDPDFFADLHRLCDFTEADTTGVSTQDLIAFGKAVKALPASPDSKSALVANDPRTAGMLKLFAARFDPSRMQVFRSRAEAIRYINVRSDEQKDQSGNIRIYRLEGRVTVRMIEEKNQDWLSSADFDPKYPLLWDLRGAEFADSLPTMEAFGDEMFARQKQAGEVGKSAVLVTSTYQTVVLQHCFQKSLSVGRTKLFKDEDEARQWLLESE